jgi:prepilin-type N-terminal cleavage/methylation domain-containing protein
MQLATSTKKFKAQTRKKRFSCLQPSAFSLQSSITSNENGFTLLEVLIVLFILGMISVMAWPALGILDDRERESITREKMEVIRRAIVGDPDRFDANGRRIIGGYVGDMEKWPDLWEAKADVVPFGCDSNCTCEDPAWDPFSFGFRPAGKFVEKRWKWCRPFRKVLDGGFEYKEPDGAGYVDDKGTPADSSDDVYHIGNYAHADYCKDHIGGLETENEGQPRGLWTDDPKEDVALSEPENPDKWKGPYLAPPMDECLKDSDHWAETCNEYMSLEPVDGWVWVGGPPVCNRIRTWEDGDYAAGHEYFDEKESFRLLQTDGRLADGWGRALRFFITADQDRPGSTIFRIISEGPDKEGAYPTKGTFGGAAWVSDPDDIMSKAYDDEDDYNKDNIVMKIYSHEWEAVFEEINEKKKMETQAFFLMIKKAILGSSPGGMNDGFTGDVCRWPKLFRWEDNGTPADPTDDYWDDEDDPPPDPNPYTKGQLRELWTRTPNSDPVAGGADDVDEPAWAHAGIGWRGEYLQTPWGINGEQFIRDAWDREVLFFKDDTNDAVMILSRGADGEFDFGSTNAEKTEPVNYTEVIDIVVTPYDPNDAGGYNADNIVLIIRKSEWSQGYFSLNIFTVNNATYNAGTGVYTKARFFYADGHAETRIAGTNGSVVPPPPATNGQWVVGASPPPPSAFDCSLFTDDVATGARYLVFWNDADGDGEINTGDTQYTYIYNIITSTGSNQIDSITLDATVNFTAVP